MSAKQTGMLQLWPYSRKERRKCNSPRAPTQALYAGKTPEDFKGSVAYGVSLDQALRGYHFRDHVAIYISCTGKCKYFRYRLKWMKEVWKSLGVCLQRNLRIPGKTFNIRRFISYSKITKRILVCDYIKNKVFFLIDTYCTLTHHMITKY